MRIWVPDPRLRAEATGALDLSRRATLNGGEPLAVPTRGPASFATHRNFGCGRKTFDSSPALVMNTSTDRIPASSLSGVYSKPSDGFSCNCRKNWMSNGYLDVSFFGRRLAVFALDWIRLTHFAIECQLGIVRKCSLLGVFQLFILLVTPLIKDLGARRRILLKY